MKLEKEVVETGHKKRREFLIGFGGWFGINILLLGVTTLAIMLGSYLHAQGLIASDGSGLITIVAGSLAFLINIGGLILLGFTRPHMAAGALAAMGLGLVVLTVLAPILFLVWCFSSLG